MMVSTKGRYALRLMLDLARQPHSNYISVRDISERQNVSAKYLEAIVSKLNKAGMLDSQHGKNGGYKLNKNPDEYSIYSILNAADGTLAPVACLDENGNCTRCSGCLTKPMWDELFGIIKDYLESKTLNDLLLSEDNGDVIE